MANQPMTQRPHSLEDDLHGLKEGWVWFLVLGIALVILGIVAISSAFITTLVTVTVLGMLILAAGIAQVISAFWSPRWSGLFLSLLIGLLYVVVGFMLIDSPIQAAAGLTLLIAVFLIMGGIFRIASSMVLRFRHWGLSLLNGVISLMLGIIIWRHMLDEDHAFLWVIGIFVGIEILFSGAAWIAFALAAKNLSVQPRME
jgi:uncharacterized membrane protein HdeD (DUF308 family)